MQQQMNQPDFDAFIGQAWDDHVADSPGVAERLLAQASALASEEARILPLAHLAHHVMGPHLGRWQAAITFQRQLAALPHCTPGGDAAQAIGRYIASLQLAAGQADALQGLAPSDRIRVAALAAGCLAEFDAPRAQALLQQAQAEFEAAALPDSDPSARALAVAGNGIAGTLEDKTARTPAERELMIRAAQAARVWWERAGTWLEVERAEYRLALSWLQAGDLAQARRHAQTCLEMVQAQDAPALEHFFAWEALGRVERAAGNATGQRQALAHMDTAFQGLDDSDRGWCAPSLQALRENPA